MSHPTDPAADPQQTPPTPTAWVVQRWSRRKAEYSHDTSADHKFGSKSAAVEYVNGADSGLGGGMSYHYVIVPLLESAVQPPPYLGSPAEMTFQQYLTEETAGRRAEFRIVVSRERSDTAQTLYIHPLGRDGKSLDFAIEGNVLRCLTPTQSELVKPSDLGGDHLQGEQQPTSFGTPLFDRCLPDRCRTSEEAAAIFRDAAARSVRHDGDGGQVVAYTHPDGRVLIDSIIPRPPPGSSVCLFIGGPYDGTRCSVPDDYSRVRVPEPDGNYYEYRRQFWRTNTQSTGMFVAASVTTEAVLEMLMDGYRRTYVGPPAT